MNNFKFIDLFSGIGGFHLALASLGGKCVFASEMDIFARKTYEYNFKSDNEDLFNNGLFNEDIRKINPLELPDFDILCAGFPCQPFSQAGYRKGFSDNHKSERGNLFFNIVDILAAKKPKAFFLENVQGLLKHNNGDTFKIIQNILQDELGYSFNYKIIRASDYGLPQLRPRIFMIGIKDEGRKSDFKFPNKVPLKFNMSNVWGGDCSREIGFTLRVGGRGSNINDRRNWDAYLVDGEVKKIMPEQAKKMQGFPDDFIFPVTSTQAMKQLGNSVAVDAVKICAKALIDYLNIKNSTIEEKNIMSYKNKGEWTELYAFLKLIYDKKILLCDKYLNIKNNTEHFNITKITTLNINQSCYLLNDDTVLIKNVQTDLERKIKVSEFLNIKILKDISEAIINGSATFDIPECNILEDDLGISIIKGGNSTQKSDIILDINTSKMIKNNEGFGIKSYLGSKPTLLNASGNTNFIYEVINFDKNINIQKIIDDVNNINTKNKLKDRIEAIINLGGQFKFNKIEADSMQYNLSLVDSSVPDMMSQMLLEFYLNRTNKISSNLENIFNNGHNFNTDLPALQIKIKRLLTSILLGFFAGKKWDGIYLSNGLIVVKENGTQVAFHITDIASLESYLFENIKFDTPSTTRHRYGSLFMEKDNKIYFKLNMQLRF